MGTVFRAVDTVTGRPLAIKEVLSIDTDMRLAFEREAHLLAQLEHPALPAVVDFFSDENALYLAMSYIPGADLAARLSRRASPFPPATALDWADQLLDLLGYLHSRYPTVVHRDIKPRNIKQTTNGQIVLLDFGLAKGHPGTENVSLAGYTIAYAPPEQIRGEGTEPRSDLFALAATLYELMTRRLAPDCLQRIEAIAAGRADPLIPANELNSAVPAAVAAVIGQSLNLRPSARPPTSLALKIALHEARSGDVTVLAPAFSGQADVSLTLRPTGTVALLATEIVTRAPVPSASVARHDAVLRAAVDSHAGYVFRTDKRGLYSAFATADAALAAALAAQRALLAEPWDAGNPLRVRMVLHAGAVELIGDEYIGPVLPRLTRLLTIGHGGQILVAHAVRELTADRLPDGVVLNDLGEHYLSGLAEPVRIYQVASPDLPVEFPPLSSLAVRSSDLPAPSSLLIGREHDLAQIGEQLRRPAVRLVTLVGPGGVGKTRLALAASEALLDDFADGVYFVQLSALRNPLLVTTAIAQALGVQENPGQSLRDTLVAELGDRRVLLVLDNVEQVLSAGEDLEVLLDGTPDVKMLVTSRVPLRIAVEHTNSVPPLACPSLDRMPQLAELGRYPAIALFVARARDVRPDFVLTSENMAAIAGICARLDGLPLALELAASRANYFTPDALLARLAQRLPALVIGGRSRPARQHTLRATLAWSYELLSPAEQQLFARLSIFTGGFDLEAATDICAVPTDTGLALVDGLASLTEHCLLQQVVTTSGDNRYAMLETVREYAAERFASAADRSELCDHHASFFLALAEAGDAELAGKLGEAWLTRLAVEHDNLRTALTWLSEQPGSTHALQLAAALWRFWQVQGHLTEGRSWLEWLLTQSEPQETVERARALVGAGALAWRQHDAIGARLRLEEAERVCRAVDDRVGRAAALKHLGLIALYETPPDHALAATHFEASLAIRRELNDVDGTASSLNDLANLAFELGEFDRAAALLEESLALCRALNNRYGLGFVLHNLSLVALERCEYERAAELLHECLELVVALNSRERIGCELWAVACVAAARGRHFRAATLYGGADALREDAGAAFSEAELATLERKLDPTRRALDPADWDLAVAAGRAKPVGELVVEAFAELDSV